MQICRDLENCINMSIKKSQLPNELKAGDITAIFKKEGPLNKKKNTDQHVCSRHYLKYLKECYLTNLKNFKISFFLSFCVVLEKDIALHMHS